MRKSNSTKARRRTPIGMGDRSGTLSRLQQHLPNSTPKANAKIRRDLSIQDYTRSISKRFLKPQNSSMIILNLSVVSEFLGVPSLKDMFQGHLPPETCLKTQTYPPQKTIADSEISQVPWRIERHSIWTGMILINIPVSTTAPTRKQTSRDPPEVRNFPRHQRSMAITPFTKRRMLHRNSPLPDAYSAIVSLFKHIIREKPRSHRRL